MQLVDEKTPLYNVHAGLGARMTSFGGWLMPLFYTNIIDEHMAVRTGAGLFDLSHMGEFDVRGREAEKFLQKVIVNDCGKLFNGKILYSPMCREDGGIIDDLLVYRFNEEHFMVVVNAANIKNDFEWMKKMLSGNAEIKDISGETSLVAVQGPESENILSRVVSADLKSMAYYTFASAMWNGFPVIISRTGYTGDDGFEIYIKNEGAGRLWDDISSAGNVKPVGLGARDTLRLEAALPLYGMDLDLGTNPIEADLKWTVGWNKKEFVGREALLKARDTALEKRLFCFQMEDSSIPRHGCGISVKSREKGNVSSGTMSPYFKKGIGMGYMGPDGVSEGTKIEIDIRGKSHPAVVVKKPFYRKIKK